MTTPPLPGVKPSAPLGAGLIGRALQWLFRAGGPLGDRVIRGGIWLLFGEAVTRLASVGKLVVTGRLLAPTDFGLMGIAVVVLKAIEYFTETGFNAALIRKPGDIRPYLDTAWTVQALRGFLLGSAVALGAPVAAWFFANPDATPIVRAAAIVIALRGLTNPATVVFLRKELDFQREVRWKLSGAVAGFLVAIPTAYVYRSVWALVLSLIAAQAVETAMSYRIEPYRPWPRLDLAKAGELTRFGRWVFLSNLTTYLGQYLDTLVVARFLGTTALGFYAMALNLAALPTAQVGSHVRGIMYPAFARLEAERDLRAALLRSLAVLSAVLVPVGWFVTFFADPLVHVVLGAKWASIVPALRILTWAGVVGGATGFVNEMLSAVGKPQLPVRASLLRIGLSMLLLYPLVTHFAITGAALAMVTGAVAAAVYQLLLAARIVHLTAAGVLRSLRLAVLGSVPFVATGLVRPASVSAVYALAAAAIAAYLVILVVGLRAHLRLGARFGLVPR